MSTNSCRNCGASFKDKGRLSRHLGARSACQQYYNDLAHTRATTLASERRLVADGPPGVHDWPTGVADPPGDMHHGHDRSPSPDPDTTYQEHPSDFTGGGKRRRVTVEEVEDQDAQSEPWVYEDYPGDTANGLGNAMTHFEDLRADQEALQQRPHAPFQDAEEWDLVRWLMKRTTQTGVDEFSKLPIIRNRVQPSFKNKKGFLRLVDKLPSGPEWLCDVITVTGDLKGPNGELLTEELEIWRRDPVDCCRELIGNPVFEPYMAYRPVKVRRDGTRYYSEMNTGEWWWDKQGELPAGAVVAPIILASDKTHLTVLRGDKTAWPVYLSIGNIDKAIRRKPSAHAVLLLGYIPVSKLNCFSKAAKSNASYRLFHTCMSRMLEPLIAAGETGVTMTCADRIVRQVYPILAAYIADHPEQCLIACCKENRCPRCLVPRKRRGDNKQFPWRDHNTTANILRRAGIGDPPSSFDRHGLRPVYTPFWATLPRTDVFASISPDILHQLHKGVIKDHLLVWCEKVVGKKALDERFAAMSKAHGLRHFHRGISMISQWTGSEAKEIEKVLLGLLVGRVSVRVLKAVRALLDFTYLAQYEVHSDATLSQMRAALDTFHRNKSDLITLGVREHFNIPKLHSLIHYVEAVTRLGCLDGLNTENSERLHIDLAKNAYRASSRREYVAQMTTWLQRQEAIERRNAYLAWIECTLAKEITAGKGVGDEDGRTDEDADNADNIEEGDEERLVDDDQETVSALRQLMNSNVKRAFQLPMAPTVPRVPLHSLASEYGAHDLLLQLNVYLHEHFPRLPPLDDSIRLDVFHSLSLLLPANVHISNNKRLCKLRASPTKPRVHDRKAVPARFDCGLFIDNAELFNNDGGVEGLRPGQVRVIFQLPDWTGVVDPLMYVHWFRPFRAPDHVTGLHPTSHSTRARQCHTTVVHVKELVRPCHLIPKFGNETIDPSWSKTDVLDEPITFLLNRYLDFHTFESLSTF